MVLLFFSENRHLCCADSKAYFCSTLESPDTSEFRPTRLFLQPSYGEQWRTSRAEHFTPSLPSRVRFLKPPRCTALRFMGMKGAIVTNNPGLTSFGGKLRFTVFPFNDLNGSSVNVATHGYGLLKLLGFQEGKANVTSQFDIVFVHIGAGESMTAADGNTVASDVEYMNALVHGIMNVAEPGSEIGSRLHLSLVLGGNLVIPVGRFLHEVAFKLWKAPKYGA